MADVTEKEIEAAFRDWAWKGEPGRDAIGNELPHVAARRAWAAGWRAALTAAAAVRAPYPDPTPEMLQDPAFNAIWNAIKGWDIQRSEGEGYHGPTGNDARHILDALTAAAAVRAPVEPVGWKLVPVEPTDAMFDAAWELVEPKRAGTWHWEKQVKSPGDLWTCMLAASPPPPSSEEATPTPDQVNIWRASDLLDEYAEFIASVPAAELEQHPYLPEVQAVAAALRTASPPPPSPSVNSDSAAMDESSGV